jgi:hypothetical protein
LGAQILNVHDLNTNLNYLSSNILSLYCIFDVQNLVLCLNRELVKIIDYKFMLKLQCKTTFNSVFVSKKNHQNRTRVDFGIMFLENVVLHEIYSKKSQWPNTFGTSLYNRLWHWLLFILFTHSWLITGFVTRVTWQVPLVEQELFTLPGHLSSPLVFSGVGVTRSLIFCVHLVFHQSSTFWKWCGPIAICMF